MLAVRQSLHAQAMKIQSFYNARLKKCVPSLRIFYDVQDVCVRDLPESDLRHCSGFLQALLGWELTIIYCVKVH